MEAVTGQSGNRHVRRIGIAAAVTAAAISLTSCATGQHAATATEKPAIAGTGGHIGSIDLLNVSVQAPNVAGRATGTMFYTAGDNAPLTLTLVNTGHTSDTLTAVTSTAFSSWGIVSTAAASDPTATGGSTSQVVPPQTRVSLGLSGLGTATGDSPETLVLRGLSKTGGNLYPGSTVPITFTFANAGAVTLQVPVDLTASQTTGSIAPPAGQDAGA